MQNKEDQPEAIISLEGTFDLPAARLLENSLKRMSAGDRVRVDFRHVRQFHDFGVAFLAQALKNSEAIVVKLEGLGAHHVRLLRYFGVGPEVFRPERRQGDVEG